MKTNIDTTFVLIDIERERIRQDKKWGEQNCNDGTNPGFTTSANAARELCDVAAKHGRLTWGHILTEEYYEALAETDPLKLREELVQVAAVAAAWVECIDRRARKGVPKKRTQRRNKHG